MLYKSVCANDDDDDDNDVERKRVGSRSQNDCIKINRRTTATTKKAYTFRDYYCVSAGARAHKTHKQTCFTFSLFSSIFFFSVLLSLCGASGVALCRSHTRLQNAFLFE